MLDLISKLVEQINEEVDLEKNINQLKDIIIKKIYEAENYELLSQVIEQINSQDIIHELEDEVRNETSLFMGSIHIRKSNSDDVCHMIKVIFKYIYVDHESFNYAFSQEKIDKSYAVEIQRIMNYAEYLIIGKSISKRWFKSIFEEKGKLSEKIIECIWEDFTDNRNQIKETVQFRYLASIDQKLNVLMKEHDDINENLQFIQYLILDDSAKEEK